MAMARLVGMEHYYQRPGDRGMREIPRISSSWLDTLHISDLDWRQAMAMARLVGMEHYYQRMAPSLHTVSPIPFQTSPVPIQYSQRSLPPQPTQRLPAPVQYVRRYEDWSFRPRRTTLQSTPTFHNRFTLQTNPERCINGPFNSRQMTHTRNHFQPNLSPMAYALPQHPTGIYWSYSLVTQTQNSIGYQSVHQERMQCRWSNQSPSGYGEMYRRW